MKAVIVSLWTFQPATETKENLFHFLPLFTSSRHQLQNYFSQGEWISHLSVVFPWGGKEVEDWFPGGKGLGLMTNGGVLEDTQVQRGNMGGLFWGVRVMGGHTSRGLLASCCKLKRVFTQELDHHVRNDICNQGDKNYHLTHEVKQFEQAFLSGPSTDTQRLDQSECGINVTTNKMIYSMTKLWRFLETLLGELSVNPKKSWSLNLRLNLKIANFRVQSSMIKFSTYSLSLARQCEPNFYNTRHWQPCHPPPPHYAAA